MFRDMPPVRNLPPGYTVVHPNRDKASTKTTKSIVVLILVASAVLMLLITFGGWNKLQGLKIVNIIWAAFYLLVAFYVARWNRGLLPIVSAFAVLLLIVALIAGTGAAGTSWFDRSHAGFAATGGLDPDLLGLLTLLLVPVQILLIVFAMQGFGQGWNVEQEVPIEEARRRGLPPVVPPKPPGEPAAGAA
jgi:presenilin-like A22 family membrane protease